MTKQSLYAPKSLDNPYRVEDGKTVEEWFAFALWYPYSVRTLLSFGRWQELARCSTLEKVTHVLKGLAALHQSDLGCYIVVQCLRRGKEGREQVMQFSPSKRHVQATLENVRASTWE